VENIHTKTSCSSVELRELTASDVSSAQEIDSTCGTTSAAR